MTTPTLSFAELEALHDVLEAARCYLHGKPGVRARAAEALKLVNRLYWRLGEELPKTGKPSERFLPVAHSSDGGDIDALVELALDLTREYANAHDPWWADTIVASRRLTAALSKEQLRKLSGSLRRLGLTLEFSDDIPPHQVIAERRNWGPWPKRASC
jgi:hypothetical protein